MSPVEKNYSPYERRCPVCGKLVITRDVTHWSYRSKDYRPETYGRMLTFCSYPCKQKYLAEYGPKKERLVLK